MSEEKRRSARIHSGHEVFVRLQVKEEKIKTRFVDRNINGIGIESNECNLEVGDKVFVEKIIITKEGIDYNSVDLLYGAKVKNVRDLGNNDISYGLEFLGLNDNYDYLKSMGIPCDVRRLKPLEVISQFLLI